MKNEKTHIYTQISVLVDSTSIIGLYIEEAYGGTHLQVRTPKGEVVTV